MRFGALVVSRAGVGALDAALYAASAALTAAGLTWIKALVPSGQGVTGLVAGASWAALPAIAAAILIYLAGLGAWLLALSRNPLSTAYPIGIGLSLAAAVFAAVIFLGESLTLAKVVGTAMIILGAAAISRARS